MCGPDAFLKIRSLINSAIILSAVQSNGESVDDFLARLGEDARYCDFQKLKALTNPKEELVKMNLSQIREAPRQN